MAVFNEPTQWDHTLGINADTSTLPDDAVATAGIASLQKLFQLINATPLEAGGIAPNREDVNALFKYLGDQIFYTQNGGIPSYNAAYDYIPGRVVLYDNNLYKCIQANGASSTVVAPDSDTAYWQRIDNFVRSVNGVNADASGNVELYDYVIENVVNSDGSWYRKWKSGWIEQGGLTVNTVYYPNSMTVNLLVPFTSTKYHISATAQRETVSGDMTPVLIIGSVTRNNFLVSSPSNYDVYVYWTASGF